MVFLGAATLDLIPTKHKKLGSTDGRACARYVCHRRTISHRGNQTARGHRDQDLRVQVSHRCITSQPEPRGFHENHLQTGDNTSRPLRCLLSRQTTNPHRKSRSRKRRKGRGETGTLCAAGGAVRRRSCYGKQCGSFSNN